MNTHYGQNKRKNIRSSAAVLLAALLAVNSADPSVLTAYAADVTEQAEASAPADVTEQTETSATADAPQDTALTITGFAAPEEAIMQQQLPVGAAETDIILPATLTVTIPAGAETADPAESEPAQTAERILAVTWEIDAAESDGAAFDSSAACDGYCYVYTPVLPEKDADGHVLVLGEAAEIPVIYVLIGESDHISTIAAEGYTEEGFCEGYTWTNGILVKNTDGGDTVYAR